MRAVGFNHGREKVQRRRWADLMAAIATNHMAPIPTSTPIKKAPNILNNSKGFLLENSQGTRPWAECCYFTFFRWARISLRILATSPVLSLIDDKVTKVPTKKIRINTPSRIITLLLSMLFPLQREFSGASPEQSCWCQVPQIAPGVVPNKSYLLYPECIIKSAPS